MLRHNSLSHDLFWLDGRCCADYGLQLQGPVTFGSPEPRVETISIPGRNGTLTFAEGAFSNVSGAARCFALREDDAGRALIAIKRWCLLDAGYRRLAVSNEPDCYRLARVSAGPETEIRLRRLAPFSIQFDCQPQRFLLSGSRPIRLAISGAVLSNPGFPAKPLITVYGSGPGTLAVSGRMVQIKNLSSSLTLDCELQDAYKGLENHNADISAPEFPVLEAGENRIGWTGGVTHIEIIPRWWTL
ncbi:MAG: hypothetical protein HFG26_08790 [Provencibacterium sp.]|jgi:phage-related protein|nr:hypothetical protein [Provencibacterium sp.]